MDLAGSELIQQIESDVVEMREHSLAGPFAVAFEQSIDDSEMLSAGFGDPVGKSLDLAETCAPMQVINYGPKETVSCCPCNSVMQLKIDRQMFRQGRLSTGKVFLNPLLQLAKIDGRGGCRRLFGSGAVQNLSEMEYFKIVLDSDLDNTQRPI